MQDMRREVLPANVPRGGPSPGQLPPPDGPQVSFN